MTEIEFGPKLDQAEYKKENAGNKEIFKPLVANHDHTKLSAQVATLISNAQVLIRHEEHTLALNLLRQASNKDSKNPFVLNLLAQTLEKLGKNEEAYMVREVHVKFDYGFNAVFKLAQLHYKSGRDEEALNKYFEALSVLEEEDESLFEIFKNIGNIFVRRGDYESAEEYYNKAYTLKSNSDILLVNLGTLEIQRNDIGKALYCFRKAVEFNSTNDKAWVGLSMIHSQLGDNELAWANLERAIDLNSQNRTAVHIAANWGSKDGHELRAIEHLQKYLSQVEQDEEMSLVLINLFCQIGRYDCALIEIERVLAWNPEHLEVNDLKYKLNKAQEM